MKQPYHEKHPLHEKQAQDKPLHDKQQQQHRPNRKVSKYRTEIAEEAQRKEMRSSSVCY
jgi:hypothetical protein